MHLTVTLQLLVCSDSEIGTWKYSASMKFSFDINKRFRVPQMWKFIEVLL